MSGDVAEWRAAPHGTKGWVERNVLAAAVHSHEVATCKGTIRMAKDNTQWGRPSAARADAAALTPAGLAAVWAGAHTARLVLRRPQAGDGPAMFAVHGDPATNRHNPAGPDLNLATSAATLRGWLRDWEANGYGYWAITRTDAEGVIGFGGVKRLAWRDRDVLNLYYRLTPSVWGQGYAAEVARTAVGLAQAYLPHLPVIARTRSANIASQRTAERAGLRRRPDLDTAHIVFALGWTPAGEPAGPA